jgi:predicted nucleic acid-binding protein
MAAKPKTIFVDADAFIALNVRTDALHQRAVKIAEKLDKSAILFTSWDAVDETATKLSYFSEKKTATAFLEEIFKGKIKVVFTDRVVAGKAGALFSSLSSKRVSLTDCVNMVVARQKGIREFFSFDQVYRKNRFKLLGEK